MIESDPLLRVEYFSIVDMLLWRRWRLGGARRLVVSPSSVVRCDFD